MPTRDELLEQLDLFDLAVVAIFAAWAIGFAWSLVRQREWNAGYQAGIGGRSLLDELARDGEPAP